MLSCVALAWHLAESSTPVGVTIATMLPCIKAFKLILSIFPAPFFLDILIPNLVCTPHPFLHPLLPMFCSHPPRFTLPSQVWFCCRVCPGLPLVWCPLPLVWCPLLDLPFQTRTNAHTEGIYTLLAGSQSSIIAEGAIALSVMLSGGALFAN